MKHVGVDDGSSAIKLIGKSIKHVVPSKIASGVVTTTALAGQVADQWGYLVGGTERYVVGNVRNPEPTDYAGYQSSAASRVLTLHALRMAGVKGEVSIVASLPFGQFYTKTGDVNTRAITRKIDNLKKNDVRALDADSLPHIAEVQVVSEALAAWFDLVLTENAEGAMRPDGAWLDKPVAVIDIGGNTVDCCLVEQMRVHHDVSGTLMRSGAIEVVHTAQKLISSIDVIANQIDDELPLRLVENAVFGERPVIRIRGNEYNVQDKVIAAKQTVAASVRAWLVRQLGSALDVERIMFVGGGALLLRRQLRDIFPDAIFPDEPQLANARGLYKYALMQASAKGVKVA